MTYFFNIYILCGYFYHTFYLPYYCNIRYVVLSFHKIDSYYYYYYYYAPVHGEGDARWNLDGQQEAHKGKQPPHARLQPKQAQQAHNVL